MTECKSGQVVSFGDRKENWIILQITDKLIDKSTAKMANPGWYAFRGLALGQNPMEPSHFKECRSLDDFRGETIHVHGDAHAFPATMLYMLLDGG